MKTAPYSTQIRQDAAREAATEFNAKTQGREDAKNAGNSLPQENTKIAKNRERNAFAEVRVLKMPVPRWIARLGKHLSAQSERAIKASMIGKALCLAGFIGLYWPGIGTAAAEVIPVETLFRPPAFSQMALSPGGSHLSVLANVSKELKQPNGRAIRPGQYLMTMDVDTRERHYLTVNPIRSIWLTDNRLLVVCGGMIEMGAVYVLDSDGSNSKMLAPSIITQVAKHTNSAIRVYDLLSPNAGEPDSVLLTSSEWILRQRFVTPDVYRANYVAGSLELVEKNPGNIRQWMVDAHGQVRAAYAVDKKKGKILYRDHVGDPWTTIWEFDAGREQVHFHGFASNGRSLYVGAFNGENTLGMYEFDLNTKKIGRCIWHNDTYDVGFAHGRGSDGEINGIIYQADRPRIEWFDPKMKAMQASVDEALPDQLNIPIQQSDAGQTVLFYSSSDRQPGAYYVYHVDKRELELFAYVAPWFKPENMAQTTPISYEARDGLLIHGYLTLPSGTTNHLPMVVLPHGGPWLRDAWGFNPEVQFLANRGYAVLQMNFRGSTGYGLSFMKAGFKQWGLKMQDDVTDGLQWAIKSGVAAPDRICIFGSSYGGYAAMTGLTQTPELYKCGINYAGPVDLKNQVKWLCDSSPEQFQEMPKIFIGDNREDGEDLDAVSPLLHVAKIRSPVMIIYGERDSRVPIIQGRNLEKQLKKFHKPYEAIFEPNEGHGFRDQTALVNLYRRMDEFLKKNL